MSYRTAVITCSDRAITDPHDHRAGLLLRRALDDLGLQVAQPKLVPLQQDAVRSAIDEAVADGVRIIFTAGGTGISPTDIVADLTAELIDWEVPGLMEEIRRRGAADEPKALLSRGVAGVINRPGARPCLIINSPSSSGGARDTITVVGGLLEYIVGRLDGAPAS